MSHRRIGRRDFLAAALGAPGLLGMAWQGPADSLVAPLQQPGLAGRPRRAITDWENDPFIVGIERRLKCTCGCNLDIYTCRTTDFTCETSPALHREIIGLAEQDLSAEAIIERFVAEHGEAVLMAPPREGFNLAAYFLPGTLILTAGSILAWVLIRRGRRATPVPVAGQPVREDRLTGVVSDADARRLEDELRHLDG